MPQITRLDPDAPVSVIREVLEGHGWNFDEETVSRIQRMNGILRGETGGGNQSAWQRGATPRYDETYEIITQGRRNSQLRHGNAQSQQSSRFRPPYRPAREIPLTSQRACRCRHHLFEHCPHIMARSPIVEGRGDPSLLQNYQDELRDLARRQALGTMGSFRAWGNRSLVGTRQSRHATGLDVSEYDVEIARRVLEDPEGWGWVGDVFRDMGWIDRVIRDGENYELQ